MATNYPFKLNGYVYSRGTKAGFSRMQRLGIPRPLFSVENKMTRILKKHYEILVKKLLAEVKKEALASNVTLDRALTVDGKEEDNLEELLKFFEDMGKNYANEQKKIADRANMGSALNTLENSWLESDGEPTAEDVANAEETREAIGEALKAEQSDYLVRLMNDAGNTMQSIIQSFSIDKQKLFNDNMEQLRVLYLDNSMERIAWEENYIKKEILKRITDYVSGEKDTLQLADLSNMAYERGEHMARLFARDQMQRFNKAITISTFTNAGVTKVKWVTTHDVRVRQTHKDLDGQIFDINALPPEIDDYNCRCGLVPVEWAN